jgi:hypothetical protein
MDSISDTQDTKSRSKAVVILLFVILPIICACVTLSCLLIYFISKDKPQEPIYTAPTKFDYPEITIPAEIEETEIDVCLEEAFDSYKQEWNETCLEDAVELSLEDEFHCTLSYESLEGPDIALDAARHECYMQYPEYDFANYDECILDAKDYYLGEWNYVCQASPEYVLEPSLEDEAEGKNCSLNQEDQERWDSLYERWVESCRLRHQ